MEENITRIGVSLPKNLLEEFDNIIRTRGYSSRSEAIRDAIRNYIMEYKWLEREEGDIPIKLEGALKQLLEERGRF